MDTYHVHCTRRMWIFVLSLLIILDCYFHVYVYYNVLHDPDRRKMYDVYEADPQNITVVYYKYPLVDSEEVSMDYKNGYNSSYYWFTANKHLFKNLSAETESKYPKNTSKCQLNASSLEPISVNRTKTILEAVEHVKLGGYYAPAHCRATNRVAVIVPYRNRKESLYTLLRYLHPLLKKQLLEYRIFVIEQFGTEKFNKGTLYNIAFLETQRFGTWHCLIFHDVDLIPEDERISYSCPEHPTHMSSAIEYRGFNISNKNISGCVTSLTPKQYEAVNGYSNFYWDWGSVDDDFYGRLESNNYTIVRYNSSIARYARMSYPKTRIGRDRNFLLTMSRLRTQKEGLATTKYDLIKINQEKLFTHILADVNPTKMKLDSKNLMQQLSSLNGKTIVGHQELKLR